MPLSDTEQRLADRLTSRHQAMLDDLAAHVSIPTGQGHQAGLDEYRGLLVERLSALGATLELIPGDPRPAWLDSIGRRASSCDSADAPIPPTAVLRNSGRAGPSILIAGHLDTVHDPRGDFQTLSMSADGAIVTGPGAVDMKGGILVFLNALEALVEEGIDIQWTVALTSDEETGSFNSAAALRSLARTADIGVIVEPALPGGGLAVERMGSGQFMIEVEGRSAHVGRAFKDGVSAVTKMAHLLLAVDDMADADAGRLISVGPVIGGQVTNAVPDYAACWGNARFPTPEIGVALGAELDALATAPDAMPCVRVDRVWSRPAKPLTPAVQRYAEAARDVAESLGQSMEFAATGGVCDGNILQDAGLPTLDTLGVRGGNLHQLDEFVEVASLVERSQLMAVLLSRVAAGAIDVGASGTSEHGADSIAR